jgi:mono/diheme cytochrome c family protein
MGVVLSLDVQTHCSVCHAASDLPMSGKGSPMALKWILSSRTLEGVTLSSRQWP